MASREILHDGRGRYAFVFEPPEQGNRVVELLEPNQRVGASEQCLLIAGMASQSRVDERQRARVFTVANGQFDTFAVEREILRLSKQQGRKAIESGGIVHGAL